LYKDLLGIIANNQQCKIMVIGDAVADAYLEGKISRISREAPVLVLEHMVETIVPGGAGNVIHNMATLGGQTYAVGVIGNDSAGTELVRILGGKGVNTDGFIVDSSRPTITKTRIMAGGDATVRQQVVRVDRENKEALSERVEKAVQEYILSCLTEMDGVVLSDYGSNTVTPRIMRKVIDLCRQYNIPCIVDSRYNVMAYTGITLVKQNESEAAIAVGYKLSDETALLKAGQTILEKLAADAVLITRGPDGMSLFEKTGKVTKIPVANKSEIYDVTGAGDTVVAMMILSLAANLSYEDAARLANYAAGVVVRKLGTATTTLEEIGQVIGK